MAGLTRPAAIAVGGLMVFGLSAVASAQVARSHERQSPLAVSTGSIHGLVTTELGEPLAGAVVSLVDGGQATAVTNRAGHFELGSLSPGRYLLKVKLDGFAAPVAKPVEVRAGARASSAVALRRAKAPSAPILAAGLGLPAPQSSPVPEPAAAGPDREADTTAEPGETSWRLRHARRSILKDDFLAGLVARGIPPVSSNALEFAGRAAGSSVRLAADFFTNTPFSGQVNFLTAGAFTAPMDLFASNPTPRGIAHVKLTAPAGASADWTVRGAVTQADISAWIFAASYATRETASRYRGFGLSYSTQRYVGGNPLALRDVTDGSRNVGEIYGFETLPLTQKISVTYGGHYAQYDYLQVQNLASPRVELELRPTDDLRIKGSLSRRELAPGAEEFLPPGGVAGIWLPPQRTFSSLEPGRSFTAERTFNAAVDVARDFGDTTVGLRVFHQVVGDQLLTLFGAEIPGQPTAKLGHYVIGSVGDAKASGGAARVETALSDRVRGTIEYSMANARLRPFNELSYIVLLPSAGRTTAEHLHDIAVSVEAEVPETATRVLVLYRVGNAYTRASHGTNGATMATRRALDYRFDVQVRQSLPFMDFRVARWEMLLAVGNVFREGASGQSVYDELLVIRPPKRIVGGLTMLF